MTLHNEDDPLTVEYCQSISKIFNISIKEIKKHSFLFAKPDSNIKNSLYYLSRIEDEETKITATFCLEFLVKYKKSPL